MHSVALLALLIARASAQPNQPPVLNEVVIVSPLRQLWTRWECRVNKWSDDGDKSKDVFLYAWKRNGDFISAFKSSYAVFPITDDLGCMRGDLISCVGQIQDTEGLLSEQVESAPVTIVNSPPRIAALHIDPKEPKVNPNLTCAVDEIIDYDDPLDSIVIFYKWFVNGNVVAERGLNTLNISIARGSTVQCQAYGADLFDSGLPGSSPVVTIGNTPPVIVGVVTISPQVPTAGVNIKCIANLSQVFDADGDERFSFVYSWKINGYAVPYGAWVPPTLAPTAALNVSNPPTFLASWDITSNPTSPPSLSPTQLPTRVVSPTQTWPSISNTSSILPSAFFLRNDTVQCSARALDNFNDVGPPLFSAIYRVANSLPLVTVTSLTPADPVTTNNLTCMPSSVVDADTDDNSFELSYAWYLTYMPPFGTSNPSTLAPTLLPTFPVQPWDPPTFSPTNYPTLSSSERGKLEAELQAKLNNVTYMRPGQGLQPFVRTLITGKNDNFLPWWLFTKNERVECEVRAFDGRDYGPYSAPVAVLVQNSAPTLSAAIISPNSYTNTTALLCKGVGLFDPDLDPITDSLITYSWLINGALVPGQSTNELASSNWQKSDSVACKLYVSDGILVSDAVESPALLMISPVVVAFTLSDPGNRDAIFDVGDMITITFDIATNMGGLDVGFILNKSNVDATFELLLPANASLASNYEGYWLSDKQFVIAVTDNVDRHPPQLGVMQVKARPAAQIINKEGNSLVSGIDGTISPMLSGSYGNATAGFVWGNLGTGTKGLLMSPLPLSNKDLNAAASNNPLLTSAAAGKRHLLVASTDNKVFGMGSNAQGQLGLSPLAIAQLPSYYPTEAASLLAEIHSLEGLNVKVASCGDAHSVVLTGDGTVLVSGDNSYGQLGLASIASVNSFTPLPVYDEVDSGLPAADTAAPEWVLLAKGAAMSGKYMEEALPVSPIALGEFSQLRVERVSGSITCNAALYPPSEIKPWQECAQDQQYWNDVDGKVGATTVIKPVDQLLFSFGLKRNSAWLLRQPSWDALPKNCVAMNEQQADSAILCNVSLTLNSTKDLLTLTSYPSSQLGFVPTPAPTVPTYGEEEVPLCCTQAGGLLLVDLWGLRVPQTTKPTSFPTRPPSFSPTPLAANATYNPSEVPTFAPLTFAPSAASPTPTPLIPVVVDLVAAGGLFTVLVSHSAHPLLGSTIYAFGRFFGASFAPGTQTSTPMRVGWLSSVGYVAKGGEGVLHWEGVKPLWITQVAAGAEHVLFLCNNGFLFSWGRGVEGQLGLGDGGYVLSAALPVRVRALDPWNDVRLLHISAGSYHSLAVGNDGRIYCWGSNTQAQCGIESSSSSVAQSNVPSPTLEPSSYAIRAPYSSSFRDATSSFLDASALNSGIGTYVRKPVALPRSLLPPNSFPRSVSAGDQASIVVDFQGHVHGMGWNLKGVLGLSGPRYGSPRRLTDGGLEDVNIENAVIGGEVGVAYAFNHPTACTSDCSFRGGCYTHGSSNSASPSCMCAELWSGAACNIPICPLDARGVVCGGNGKCVLPNSLLQRTYAFSNSTNSPTHAPTAAPTVWVGNNLVLMPVELTVEGKAESPVCDCSEGHTGDTCEEPDCSTLGNCGGVGGRCVFDANYPRGVKCQCDIGFLPPLCSTCDVGFVGDDCRSIDCSFLNNCGGHGICIVKGGAVQCDCSSGWKGDMCEQPYCAKTDARLESSDPRAYCSNHGSCLVDSQGLSTCKCDNRWTGFNCESAVCYGAISGMGYCNLNGMCIIQNGAPVCICNAGFSGEDCSVIPSFNGRSGVPVVQNGDSNSNAAPSLPMTLDNKSAAITIAMVTLASICVFVLCAAGIRFLRRKRGRSRKVISDSQYFNSVRSSHNNFFGV